MSDLVNAIAKPIEKLVAPVAKPAGTVVTKITEMAVMKPVPFLVLSVITIYILSGMYNDLPKKHQEFLNEPLVRMTVLYLNIYLATGNVKQSLMITAVFYGVYVLNQYLESKDYYGFVKC